MFAKRETKTCSLFFFFFFIVITIIQTTIIIVTITQPETIPTIFIIFEEGFEEGDCDCDGDGNIDCDGDGDFVGISITGSPQKSVSLYLSVMKTCTSSGNVYESIESICQ